MAQPYSELSISQICDLVETPNPSKPYTQYQLRQAILGLRTIERGVSMSEDSEAGKAAFEVDMYAPIPPFETV